MVFAGMPIGATRITSFGFAVALAVGMAFYAFPAFAQKQDDVDETDTNESHDYDVPDLPKTSPEVRARAIRELKRVEKRSKAFGIFLNRGKMEKLKGDRILKVLKEYDRFVSALEELPEGFVKACNIRSVWFSDEIVDMSGQHAGGTASGEGINLAIGFKKGTVYHEMFHKFERCITDSQRRERSAKVRDIISSRSCCFIRASNDPPSRKFPERDSRLPGSSFFLSNWDFNVAASILEKKAEADVISVFDEVVAKPLRLRDWNPSLQERAGDLQVSEHLAYRFYLSARDMARIGQVMLRKGRWKGLQIVSESWATQSTGVVSKLQNGEGFGYMWWVENEEQDPKIYKGAYSARGLDGQRLTVLPALNMVVAHLPRTGGKKMKNSDYKKLLQAVFMASIH